MIVVAYIIWISYNLDVEFYTYTVKRRRVNWKEEGIITRYTLLSSARKKGGGGGFLP